MMDVTRLGLTPLIRVCGRPDNDEAVMIARVLLENGADVNGRDLDQGPFPSIRLPKKARRHSFN